MAKKKTKDETAETEEATKAAESPEENKEEPSSPLADIAKAIEAKVNADKQQRGMGQPNKVDRAFIAASQELKKILKG